MTENNTKPLKIGMIGAGTVGSGVYNIISNLLPTKATRRPMLITKIIVRDASKPRPDLELHEHTTIHTDINAILDDPEIELLVEVAGGTSSTIKTVIYESLKRGKSVVTANKTLIAAHLDEIQDIVSTTGKKGTFEYEAAVCGGIPVIAVLRQGCYEGDEISQVMGICNGTTNYMLGKMTAGVPYDTVLSEAQSLGYAEADPTADVEGYDVRAKIAILAKLAFGTTIDETDIPCKGITKLTKVDFDVVEGKGCCVKLIGCAMLVKGEGGKGKEGVAVYVTPMVIPKTHPLSSATGSGNLISLTSRNMGITSYAGPGAGRYPTANSVVADICRVASRSSSSGIAEPPFPEETSRQMVTDYSSPGGFYVRVGLKDNDRVPQRVDEIAKGCGDGGVEVKSVELVNDGKTMVILTGGGESVGVMTTLCDKIKCEEWAVGEEVFFMPVVLSS